MARYYRFSKSITEDEAREILKALSACPNLKKAEVTKDGSYLLVDADDEMFLDVMTRAVNICSRAAGGCRLAFAKFAV